MNNTSIKNRFIGNSAGINMTATSNGNTLIGCNAGIYVGSNSFYNTCLGYGAIGLYQIIKLVELLHC